MSGGTDQGEAKITEDRGLIASAEDSPVSGADLFAKTARQPGGQAERARYFEANIPALTRLRDWSAELAGRATDGTIIYKKEKQVRVLAIKEDGSVYTGSWNEEVISSEKGGIETLICNWASPGWKQW
jgi:hypothetical protein